MEAVAKKPAPHEARHLAQRTLRVVIYLNNGYLVAVGLERFVTGQGRSVKEAVEALLDTHFAEAALRLEHGEPPLCPAGEAPREYFEMWEGARRIGDEAIPEDWPFEGPRPSDDFRRALPESLALAIV